MKQVDITEGLAISAWTSINKAIESNSVETVYSFVSFFRGILRESIRYRNIKPFTEFVSFPSRVYFLITYKHKDSQAFGNLVNKIAEQMSLHLKEVIMTIDIKDSKSSSNANISTFYYESFKSFNNLFFLQTKYQDWNLLISSLTRYSQLTNNVFDLPSQRMVNLNENDINNDIKRNLQIDLQNNYSNYRRQPLSAIKYWLIILLDEGILGQETLVSLMKAIARNGDYDPNKEIEDILFFRSGDLRVYMGWEDWDFQERPDNEAYYPPMPINWMTKGFVIDRIRNKNSYFNTSKVRQDLISGIPILYDDVKDIVNSLRNNFDKWQKILVVDSVEDFNLTAANLLSSIALAKRSVIGDKERTIVTAPINVDYMQEFVHHIGTAWRAQTRIRRIFNYFGNIKDVTEEEILLKRVGTNTLLEKGKVHFIDGEYHTSTYGLEYFGGLVGTWEDSLFFEVIKKSAPIIIGDKSLLTILLESIAQLVKSGVVPSAILIEPEYLYKDDEFLRSEKYNRQYDEAFNPETIGFFVLGTFDDIPIFSSNSFQLKNNVIVSNFEEAFLMLHKTNEQWFDNELSVIVDEVTDKIANQKYTSNPDKWKFTDEGIELSEVDAKTLIKTSVIIDIETIVDFKVIDKSKFILGYITEPISD